MIDGCIDGWINGGMDGWREECDYHYVHKALSLIYLSTFLTLHIIIENIKSKHIITLIPLSLFRFVDLTVPPVFAFLIRTELN